MSNNQIVQLVFDLAQTGQKDKLQNCDINCRNRYGVTALMMSVMENNFLALRTLLSAGADVNLTRNNSRYITALTIAVERHQVEFVKELIKAGASLTCEKAIDALKMAKNYNFLHLVIEGDQGVTNHSFSKYKKPFCLAYEHKCFDLLVDLINSGCAVDIELLQFEDFIRPDIFNALIRSGHLDINKQYWYGKTMLMKAVQTNDINIMKFLLEKSVNIDQKDFDGNTALHFACGGKSDIIKLLVEAGAKLDVKNKEGSMPLHVAAAKSDTEMIELLIKAKVDINCLDRHKKTALEICVEKSDLNTTTLLLQHGAEVNVINRRGITPLIYAVIKGDEKLVDILIAHKADVNFIDPNQNTPLINAVLKGNKSILSQLIKAGANVNTASKSQYYRQTPCLNKLFLCKVGLQNFQLYSPTNNHNTLEDLLTNQTYFPVIQVTKYVAGQLQITDTDSPTLTLTPLHIATQSSPKSKAVSYFDEDKLTVEAEAIVHLLLEAGADVHVTDEQGRTPLHIAAIYGDFGVVKELCQFGANVNVEDTFRSSPLFFSILYNHQDVSKYLIESGADVNLMCDSQCSPLYAAVVHNNLELVELMINHGALCDMGKTSELLMALSHANTDMSVMLLKHGANPNVKDNDETLALMLCLRLMKCGSVCMKYDNIKDIYYGSTVNFSGRKRVYNPNTGFLSYETPKKVFICDEESLKTKTLTLIESMLNHGASVLSTDKDGNSCLNVAAMSCCKKILELFVACKADVNHQNEKGVTPLMIACMSGNVETAEILLKAGANVFLVDNLKYTALHHSVRNLSGLLPLVKLLTLYAKIQSNLKQHVEQGNSKASSCGSGSNVQLHDCVTASSSGGGSSSNVQLHDCVTAPSSGGGSSSNVQLHDCVTAPEAAAVDTNSEDLINMTNVNGENALHMACRSGHIHIVMLLMQNKCNINVRNKFGKTPLMISLENKFTKIAEHLIDNKANVNIKDNKGDTALHLAVDLPKGYDTCMFLHALAHNSANINETNNEGQTPLFFANNDHAVELLIEKGADVDIQDKNGESALHFATKNDKRLAVYQLTKFSKSRSLDITSNTGHTALMYAADFGNFKIIKHLVNIGADVNIRDIEGMNACLHAVMGLRNNRDQYVTTFVKADNAEGMIRGLSMEECLFKMIDILVSAGADVNICDNKNCSLIVHTLLNNETHKQHKYITTFLKLGVEPLVPEEHRYLLRDSSCYKQTYGEKSIYNINMNGSEHMFQFLLLNGIVLDFTKNFYSKFHNSNLSCAFWNKKLNFVQFFIATGCIFKRDEQSLLREIRLTDEADVDSDDTTKAELAVARTEPWPLVKLAFIEVSTLLGTGPMREEKLKQTKLPPRLRRTLMFQEPISRLPVAEWSKIPLCFDPVQYETLPCPRPLLYYWPVGHKLVA